MQVRIWGTPEENREMIELLRSNLGDKIKIISSAYPSVNGVTQRIYVEIDSVISNTLNFLLFSSALISKQLRGFSFLAEF